MLSGISVNKNGTEIVSFQKDVFVGIGIHFQERCNSMSVSSELLYYCRRGKKKGEEMLDEVRQSENDQEYQSHLRNVCLLFKLCTHRF